MPRLILIKHASPEVVPSVASDQWRLSARGRESCGRLAERVRSHAPGVVVSSIEPKAIETAELVAAAMGVPHQSAPDLQEHDRSNVPHMRSSEFISMMELFFRQPDVLVLGRETAQQAAARFSQAVEAVLSRHPQDNVAIITHGTVLALFLEQYAGRSAFHLWRELGLPSFAVMEWPGRRLLEIVDHVA